MAEIQKPATVKVRLVWPAERGAKDDCRGGTRVVWSEYGDVQDYPAEKFRFLEPHPDVWELVNPDDAELARTAENRSISTQKLVEKMNADAAEARDKGRETNTDVVTALPAQLTAEQLFEMTDEEVHAEASRRGFRLHKRYTSEKLRERFLEAQSKAAHGQPHAETQGEETPDSDTDVDE